jgi:Icc-related predicted phosphoesterase
VLDVAPLLDTSVYPPKAVLKLGQQVLTNVGSSSVRVAIEKYQPPLVLCGHIHESNGVCRIGKSLVINPGSEYGEGILKGAIVNLADKKVLSYQLVSG